MRKSLLTTLLVTVAMLPFCLLGYIDSFLMMPVSLLVLLALLVLDAQRKQDK